MSKFYKKWYTFWAKDQSLTILLFTLIVTVFFIYPLAEYSKPLLNAAFIFLALNFITGIYAITKNKTHRYLGILFTIILMAAGIFSISERTGNGRIIELILLIIFFSLLALIILIRVFADGRVNVHRVQGAIVVYILFGLIFGFIYMLIAIVLPDSFIINERLYTEQHHYEFKYLYYSFITLCTIGYGDITPVSQIAQSIAMLEAITGILFPAVLIARLLSLPHTEN